MSSAPTGRLSKLKGDRCPDLSLAAHAAVLPDPSLLPFFAKAAAMSLKLTSAAWPVVGQLCFSEIATA